MKFKTDENIGMSAAMLLRHAGHDVSTVKEQDLCGATDQDLISICRVERRCLVTLDMDFSNPFRFVPSDYSGVAVLRLPPNATPDDMHAALRTLLAGLSQSDIVGKLWVVRKGRIREYAPDE